jgi:hypothetical protein
LKRRRLEAEELLRQREEAKKIKSWRRTGKGRKKGSEFWKRMSAGEKSVAANIFELRKMVRRFGNGRFA